MDENTTPMPSPAAAPRATHRWRWLWAVLLALLLLIVAAASSAWWALRTERGTAWLLPRLPGVQVDGARGALLGDFQARLLVVTFAGGASSITLTDLGWRGFAVQRAGSSAWAHITIDALTAARIDLVLAPAKTAAAPSKAPSDLGLPIELELRSLKVGEVHAAALGEQPLRDIDAALFLGADNGALHRIDHLSLRWDRLVVNAQGRIASAAPMTVDAKVALAQDQSTRLPAWAATVDLAGPLAAPVLHAQLRASPGAGQAAQSLDAQGTLHPFAAWPLGEFEATAEALDLNAFSHAAPVTALSLKVQADTSAPDQPARVVAELANSRAGRWSEGRLPLQHLQLELAVRPDRLTDIELRSLKAELGASPNGAGTLTASGHYTAERWTLAAVLAAVRTDGLDARAPAMTLSGPLALAGGGTEAEIRSTLTGSVVDHKMRRALTLALDASLNTGQIALRTLKATAGAARIDASGTAAQSAPDQPWTVKAQAAFSDVDPVLWWPGDEASPWQGSTNKLNAKLAVDLRVPPPQADQAPLQMLIALRGKLDLVLDRSMLAGVPLAGSALLRSESGSTAQLAVRLDAAGNAVRVDGQLATGTQPEAGARDTLDLAIDARTLERLAPIFKLLQPAGADATFGGALAAHAHIAGRWPTLTTRGDLEASGLRIGTVGVQQARARWTAGTGANDRLDLQATLGQVTTAPKGNGPSIASASLQLSGTARAHALSARIESKARPPAWTDAPTARPAGAAPPTTVATVQLRGGLVDQPGAALSGWRGMLQQLSVSSSDDGAAPLLRTQNVALEAFWAGGPAKASAQAGRLELLGSSLRWSQLAWQAGDATHAPRLDAQAQLEPFRIAPLLARIQPELGWGGDLSLSGHLVVHSAPSVSADIVVERSSGDLSVSDELGSHSLGLSDLRLGLNADGGVWNFTVGIAGRTLGVTSGAVVARTSPQALWPAADAPLDGVLELKVADLDALSAWVPPGWRVGGALHASARFGGRFGAPEYTGEVEGTRLSVRNFLEGVKLSDGDVAIRLQGTHATIDRFSAKGGEGTLKLAGSADFGSAPRAELQLNADKFVLLGRVDRRIVASGNGTVQLDARSLGFSGKFGVDEGLIDFSRSDAPSLSEDVQVTRAVGVPSPAAAASAAAAPRVAAVATVTPTTPARTIAMNLQVDLGDKLALRGHGLDARLAGTLQITSPDNKLAVNGTVRVVDGTYEAYGQNLVIDRGLVAFSGPIDRPRLDIEATRPKLDTVHVGVTITGTAANPRVRLFSEPDMSEVDKLSWLVLGHASDDAGRAETALLQRAALALVSGEGPGVTDKVTKALGLDELSLGQSDGEVKQTVLNVGKKLSDRWTIGYAQGLNAATGSFQLIYKIAQRFTLRAQSGSDNSVDLIWTWRWQ